MAKSLCPELRKILLAAYKPCPAFGGACQTMTWAPRCGHIPRGFCGATGTPDQVKVVLLFAEPGDPYQEFSGAPKELLASAYQHSYQNFKSGKDLFHRNVRLILDLCWPGESFDEQMQKSWLVDSVLCSAEKESGRVPRLIETECCRRYLEPQLKLLRNAVVVALGGKPHKRVKKVSGIKLVKAFAAAPPGANFRPAKPSWKTAARAVRKNAGLSTD